MRISGHSALGLAWVLDRMGNDVFLDAKPDSPWLLVDFPTRSEQFAIWHETGAVYNVGTDGAVEDDPIYEPKALDVPPPALMDRPTHVAKVPTPELDKFLAAIEPRRVNDVLSEFIDWLFDHKQYEVVKGEQAVYRHKLKCPSDSCHAGVDVSKMSPRQDQLRREAAAGSLDDQRKRWPCETCETTGYIDQDRIDSRAIVHVPRRAAIIADFLELDEDKMEDERRALLEGLRADHLERETGVPF